MPWRVARPLNPKPHPSCADGVEPWHFYLHNLALNFNAVLPLALLSPILLVLPCRAGLARLPRGRMLVWLSGAFAWLFLYSLPPHKEERFMFPIYPLLCLAAATSIGPIAKRPALRPPSPSP